MSWNSIFEEELKKHGSILAGYTSCLVQNWYFANKIRELLSEKKACRILEAGAGTGYLAAYFSSLGHNILAMDVDTDFIDKVKADLRVDLLIAKDDIRIYPYATDSFDLIYNIGVMEHFNDQDIIRILKNFKNASDIFAFAVPNFKIPYSYGDERYLSRGHWQKLLVAAGWRVREVFAYNRYGLRKYLTGFVCTGKGQ